MLPRRSLFGLLLLAPAPALARIFAERGVALRGTDVVAYFTEARVVRGRAEFATEWNGVRWLFASAANRDRFLTDPAAHAPAYGGFCAWAVSQGYTAPTDPAAWRIVEGRLFLNYDPSIQRRWERDIPGFIAAGDANWPRLSRG
jgi:YHS domain-containing protein